MSVVGDQIMTKNQRSDMGGLSFLQSMSDITSIVRNRDDTTYIHPTEKRSVSKLNKRSLEMCTETLGTETGSESGDEFTLLAFEATTTPRVPSPQPKPRDEDTTLLAKKPISFPPPIKFDNRIVRTLGEDGRLVVQAIRVSSQPPCFVAERCEGRLRLTLSPESCLLEEEEEEEESEAEEGKSGNQKFSRLSSRCKENGREAKPMLTWKQHQFWVST